VNFKDVHVLDSRALASQKLPNQWEAHNMHIFTTQNKPP